MWREKTDKRIVAAGIILIGLLIGYGAWKDMHPPPPNMVASANVTPYYLADSNETLRALPQDGNAIIVWVGDMETDDAGQPVFKPSPIAPISIPQREIILLFKIINPIPKSLSPLFRVFEHALAPWKKTGNLVNDIYIEYLPDDPDLQSLAAFSNGMRGHFRYEYWLDVQVRRTADVLAPEKRTQLGNMLKSTHLLVYDEKDVLLENEGLKESIMRLNTEGLPFALRLHHKPDMKTLMKNLGEQGANLAGFVLEPTKEENAP